MSQQIVDDRCGEETPTGPCTMKKGHSVTWHRHQVYDTINWTIYKQEQGGGSGDLIKAGTGRLGLQYGLNDAFEVSDDLVIYVNNGNNSSNDN